MAQVAEAACARTYCGLKETSMLSMKDKVAIVTGAGSIGPGWGNGKATATLLGASL
jgi:hypothetical protein